MDFFGIHFAKPDWLWALALVPLVPLLFVLVARTKRSTFVLGNPILVGAAQGPWTFQGLPWLMRLVVLSLCLIAAAQPQAGKKKVERKKPVSDLCIVLDVSPSMLTDDLKPNRISAAKGYLTDFLDRLDGVRVAICVFGGRSFTQCPLTTDLRVARYLLSTIDVFSVKITGTAIGDGLVSAINRLKKGRVDPGGPAVADGESDKAPHSQAILLITDGGNNGGSVDPVVAALLAAREGIAIYAIGVGSVEKVPATYFMPDGTKSYALDEKGDIVYDSLLEKPLKEIARVSRGEYFRVSDNRAMGAVLSSIASMEKHEAVDLTTWEYRELGPSFLLGAFLLLALDFLLGLTILRTLP